MFINTGVTATVKRTTFTKNYASLNGGSVYIKNAENLNFINTNFMDNFSNGTGGAVYFTGYNQPSAKASFQNCDFHNNEAVSSGGGIGIVSKSARIFVEDSNFVRNVAYRTGGGAIYVYQSKYIYLINR